MITGTTSLKWSKLLVTFKFSSNQLGNYLLPLLKQLFRDNFMGSEMEMGILLLFVKSYFLLAVHAISHNALTDRFKKSGESTTKSAELNYEDIYHEQAA
ncbi:MAG: hypothetical protein JWP78_1919 [Mucilaginibacter sp.]|nr:hypothetical protein [Mucilaginibacter sp.]